LVKTLAVPVMRTLFMSCPVAARHWANEMMVLPPSRLNRSQTRL
jgi:hypothetical protein